MGKSDEDNGFEKCGVGAALTASIAGGVYMTIRLARAEDIFQISELLSEFFAYNAEQQPNKYRAAIENGDYPRAVLDSDTGVFFVAEADKRILGLIHIEENSTLPYPSIAPHKFACIMDFFVKPAHRKKNIGHLLLEEAKAWAQSRNLDHIELMVLENNEIGKSFYEGAGFVTTSQTMCLDF